MDQLPPGAADDARAVTAEDAFRSLSQTLVDALPLVEMLHRVADLAQAVVPEAAESR